MRSRCTRKSFDGFYFGAENSAYVMMATARSRKQGWLMIPVQCAPFGRDSENARTLRCAACPVPSQMRPIPQCLQGPHMARVRLLRYSTSSAKSTALESGLYAILPDLYSLRGELMWPASTDTSYHMKGFLDVACLSTLLQAATHAHALTRPIFSGAWPWSMVWRHHRCGASPAHPQ